MYERILTAFDAAGWVEKRRRPILLAIAIPLVIFAGATAAVRPLWTDEIFTNYVAQKGGLREIWQALLAAGDNHPPLDYWLRSLSMAAFGSSDLAFRLPSLVSFWTAAICAYLFVRRRAGAIYGIIALLVPFSTIAYELSYEGRYQVLVLALAGLSLVSWQAATEGSWAGAAALAASLGAALYADYNSVLLFLPPALGEVVRTVRRRRIDWRIWLAFAIAGLSLAGLLPLIRVVREFAGKFWTHVGLAYALEIYGALFTRTTTAVIGFLVLLLFLPRLKYRERDEDERHELPVHEFVAVISYLLLPLFCYALAKLFTGALHWRYTVPAVIGAATIFAYSARRVAAAYPLAPIALMVCLYGNALGHEAGFLVRYFRHRGEKQPMNLAAALPPAPMPVVIGYSDSSLRTLYYSGAEVQQRVVYLYDLQAGTDFYGVDTSERGLLGLKVTSPLQIRPFGEFLQSNRRFWLMQAADNPQEWLVAKLLDRGATLIARGFYAGEPVYEVTIPAAR